MPPHPPLFPKQSLYLPTKPAHFDHLQQIFIKFFIPFIIKMLFFFSCRVVQMNAFCGSNGFFVLLPFRVTTESYTINYIKKASEQMECWI